MWRDVSILQSQTYKSNAMAIHIWNSYMVLPSINTRPLIRWIIHNKHISRLHYPLTMCRGRHYTYSCSRTRYLDKLLKTFSFYFYSRLLQPPGSSPSNQTPIQCKQLQRKRIHLESSLFNREIINTITPQASDYDPE